VKEEKLRIEITNKGVASGLSIFSNALLGLLVFHNSNPKTKTITEYRDDIEKNLKKMINLSKRENDGTISDREMAKVVKHAKETLKMVKRLWKV
jgi:hypothetical protein